MKPWSDGSAGMARPIEAATSRLGSFVADSAITANTTCPGLSMLIPSSRSTNSQCGGKIELTRTRLKFARCASRSAISKLVSFSLCRPTPFVKKALVGMNIRESINSRLPPLVPYRGTQLDRRLGVAAPVHHRLHHLRQHVGRTQRDLDDFDLRLPALLAAHHEHVFRRVDTQPAIRGLSRHYRGAPLLAFPLDRPEDVQRLDLGGRAPRRDHPRQPGPPRALTRPRRG